ncbi:MAG: acyltransferase [Bacteroidetes bacterium]|nr:acyltransferase [Bacteroidota bacterium]
MNKPIYFTSLDGVRFFAFLSVFVMHVCAPLLKLMPVSSEFVNAFFHFLSNGERAVSLFFVLSGFLITYLLIKEKEETSSIHVANFYLRRILRIWPLYYLLVVLYIVVFPILRTTIGLASENHDSNPLFYLLFLGNFDVIHLVKAKLQGFDPLTITWSVAIEEQFYLFWPLLFIFFKGRFLLFALFSVFIGSVLFRLLHATDEIIIYYHTISNIGDLAIGGVAAYLVAKQPAVWHFFTTLKDNKRLVLYAVGFMLLFFDWWLHLIKLPYFTIFYQVLETVFLSFIILDQSFAASAVGKLANYPALTRLGKYTYGFYLLHPLAMYISEIVLFKVALLDRHTLLPLAAFALMTIPLTYGLARLSYQYLELPFLNLKKRFISA